jgi:bifunctional enzyme CysN/CysC
MTTTIPAEQEGAPAGDTAAREQMNVVIVGHVDHGKSTVIGRLLADTGSLPDGKLEQVRSLCERTARPFEYAFLLDALKDEQAQGITIDSARCFFKSASRDYIIIDAPGHVEFLKNMISGASRAEAALLVIDAKEGVRENSRRHGILLSMLGIPQMVVLVNKMDLVGYDEEAFERIRTEYEAFLTGIGVRASAFVPVSAFHGDNLAARSARMPWHDGPTVLEVIDGFTRAAPAPQLPFRMPVQDIYKFTEDGDTRRIVAGTVVAGSAGVGDEVVFQPSGKRSRIASVETFQTPLRTRVAVGEAVGMTLSTQVYLRPGEVMCRADEAQPEVGTRFKTSLFWLGRRPLSAGRRYKLKLGTAATTAYVREILRVMDASDLSAGGVRQHVERHEVAEVVLETVRPLAYDRATGSAETVRFVLVDGYDVAGGGTITETLAATASLFEERADQRRARWTHGSVTPEERHVQYRQRPRLVLVTGGDAERLQAVGASVERRLFDAGRYAYFLGLGSLEVGLDADVAAGPLGRDEHMRRLGELAGLFAEAGCILLTAVPDLDEAELQVIRALAAPSEVLAVGLQDESTPGLPLALSLPAAASVDECADRIGALLVKQAVVFDFQI